MMNTNPAPDQALLDTLIQHTHRFRGLTAREIANNEQLIWDADRMIIRPDYTIALNAHEFGRLVGLGAGTVWRMSRKGAINTRMVNSTKHVVLRTVRLRPQK